MLKNFSPDSSFGAAWGPFLVTFVFQDAALIADVQIQDCLIVGASQGRDHFSLGSNEKAPKNER